MSLYRTYRIQCDGIALAARLGLIGQGTEAHVELFRAHVNFSFGGPTSTKARTVARQSGWVRQAREFPILDSHPDAGTSTHKFDLCPSCATRFPLPEKGNS